MATAARQPGPRALYALLAVSILIMSIGLGYLTTYNDPSQEGSGSGQESSSGAQVSAGPGSDSTRTNPSASPSGQLDPPNQSGSAVVPDPGATTQAPIQGTSPTLAERMIAFVEKYYALLPDNTAAAWKLLAPSMQAMGRGSYAAFWGGIRSVDVGDMQVNGDALQITCVVTYVRKSTQTSTETQTLSLVENGDSFLIVSQT